MMGHNHIITGVCALEHVYVVDTLIRRMENPFLLQGLDIVYGKLGIVMPLEMWKDMQVHMLPMFLAAYIIGVLFPDVDNPNSILGKVIYVPVEHRTWIHAIYLYTASFIAGMIIHPAFLWFTFGVFIHLFWDSFSKMGNCWFYKLLSDYKRYPGDAKIKKGNHLVLYKAGEWTEYLVTFIVVALTVVSFIWIRR